MPSSPPAKRAAAWAALSNTKLEVRNSASACSPNWLRTWPARTPRVASSRLLSIKKPGPKRTGFFRHALAAFITRPQAVAQIGAKAKIISGWEGETELRGVALLRVARGVAAGFDAAQIIAGDVAGDVVAVEARGLEVRELRVGAAHGVLQLVEILVDERVGADFARHLLLAAVRGDQLRARRHVDAVDVREAHRRRRGSEKHLARPGLARHLHDLAAGRAAH